MLISEGVASISTTIQSMKIGRVVQMTKIVKIKVVMGSAIFH